MFYHGSIDKELRFGDVVRGYVSTAPEMMRPFRKSTTVLGNIEVEPYNIQVDVPEFCVILDPCCEIGGGVVSLSPLEEIKSQLWDIHYLAKDMTNLNREGTAKDFFHPTTWNKLSETQKSNALNAVPEYGHRPYFVYEGNPRFPEYTVSRPMKYNEIIDATTKLPRYEKINEAYTFKTRHRMIDFKNVYHLNCKKIFGPKSEPDDTILNSIVLRLSIETRNELRNKMAHYFGKIPVEDRILL